MPESKRFTFCCGSARIHRTGATAGVHVADIRLSLVVGSVLTPGKLSTVLMLKASRVTLAATNNLKSERLN